MLFPPRFRTADDVTSVRERLRRMRLARWFIRLRLYLCFPRWIQFLITSVIYWNRFSDPEIVEYGFVEWELIYKKNLFYLIKYIAVHKLEKYVFCWFDSAGLTVNTFSCASVMNQYSNIPYKSSKRLLLHSYWFQIYYNFHSFARVINIIKVGYIE